jgi:superfamily II DNA/RNA helicase
LPRFGHIETRFPRLVVFSFVSARLQSPTLSFADLGVAAELIASLDHHGITSPFAIQEAALPDSIAGRDVLGRGATGSGKTLAFGLAMLTRLVGRPTQKCKPLGLVLVPTRELAMQVHDSLAPHARTAGLRMRIIAGGMPYSKQIDALRQGVHVLVATPGRLMDLIAKKEADLSQVTITVLDEADQMADMGFLPVVKEILDMTKPNGQRLLFSATLDGGVDALVRKYLRNPVEHSIAPPTASVKTLEHHVLLVHPQDKDLVGAQIASRQGRTIFFVRTKRGADRLAEKLMSQGVAAGALHGGKSQSVRTRTLQSFKDGHTNTLVATDVAARGIHVDDISLVVHFDAPADHKDYLHRSGRTARAGAAGVSVLLANPAHEREVRRLTDKSGVKPQVVRVRPNSTELVAVTGAQEPTGIPFTPVVVEKPQQARRRPTHNRSKRYGNKRPQRSR